MLTTNDEKSFLAALQTIGTERKLLLAYPLGNRLIPKHEIRLMPTVGGWMYGMAEIDLMNRRGGGIYTLDPEEIYLRAIDVEKKMRNHEWYFVSDCEHTLMTEY